MQANTETYSFYSFISRWIFSTNHKCGVKASSVPGIRVSYRNAVTVKSIVTYLKYSRKVKPTIQIILIASLGKQILTMVSPICGVGYENSLEKKKQVYLNILFCGGKGLQIYLNYFFLSDTTQSYLKT